MIKTSREPDIFIKNLECLINGIKGIEEGTRESRFIEFVNNFNNIKPKIEECYKELLEYKRKNAPDFNIFQLLGLVNNEKFHSDFIAELLKPSGSHGQGDIFIRRFMEVLREKGGRVPEDLSKITSVRRELTVESGRIDIHIEFGKREFALIIENKIWAGEGEEQLDKYYKSEIKSFGKDNVLLVYITPSGSEPLSINEERKRELKSSGALICFSYKDISDWLSGMIVSIKPVHLVETLIMYISLIRKFGEEENNG